jgi:hypothetical protein
MRGWAEAGPLAGCSSNPAAAPGPQGTTKWPGKAQTADTTQVPPEIKIETQIRIAGRTRTTTPIATVKAGLNPRRVQRDSTFTQTSAMEERLALGTNLLSAKFRAESNFEVNIRKNPSNCAVGPPRRDSELLQITRELIRYQFGFFVRGSLAGSK